MGLLGGMPQTDYDFFHNPAPSSALVRRQVPTAQCCQLARVKIYHRGPQNPP